MTKRINPVDVPKITLSNGMEIPAMGMGTFGSDRFTAEEISDAVYGAIKVGYRLFDCASVYGNEDMIGEVFSKAFDEKLVEREELFITSKVWNDDHRQVMKALNKSLSDLQLDYLDAYFVHWPFPNYHAPFAKADDRNPDSRPFSLDEFMDTWKQMEEAYDKGLVKTLAMSNMTIPKLEAVLPHCRIKPTLVQMELHPSFQQTELFEYCLANDIQPVAFAPIGSPTRPDRDKAEDDVVDIEIPELVKIAKDHGIHPAVAALKWAVQRGQIPIPFSIREAEYYSNLESTVTEPLTDEEMDIINGFNFNSRLIKGQVFLWEGANDWEDLWDVDGEITK